MCGSEKDSVHIIFYKRHEIGIISVTRFVQDLYEEVAKFSGSFLKEFYKWRDTLCSWWEKDVISQQMNL